MTFILAHKKGCDLVSIVCKCRSHTFFRLANIRIEMKQKASSSMLNRLRRSLSNSYYFNTHGLAEAEVGNSVYGPQQWTHGHTSFNMHTFVKKMPFFGEIFKDQGLKHTQKYKN